MEQEQASACKEDKAQSVGNNGDDLRDDTFFRLLEDFLGPQSGKNLHIDETPCKNRLLVQVGLLKEEKQVSWYKIVKWLQKIFPMHQSSDFRSLVERSVATAMRLNGEARETFLESKVNFEFVGPICDLLGIGRSDLLEMSDFSDRVQCTEVTNGIVLELSSFATRERVAPKLLVCWLRNFNPQFCSDGKIEKAYQVLQKKIRKLKLDYRLHQKKGYSRKGMIDVFLQTEFNLVSNVFNIYGKRPHKEKQRLSKKSTSRKGSLCKEENGALIMDSKRMRDPVLNEVEKKAVFRNSKERKRLCKLIVQSEPTSVFHSYLASNSSMKIDCEQPTTKCCQMEKSLVKGTAVNPSAMKMEVLTLLDVSMLSLQKLWSVYGRKSHELDEVCRDLLQTQFTLMLKKDCTMKGFNDKINKTQTEPCLVIPPLHFLDCNAHFLLEVSDAIEKQIIGFEREIITASGQRLGRDKNPKFSNFVNFSESASARYIRMACDVLNPVSETRHSCEKQWLVFCQMMEKPSKLAVCHSNRFISYYECAASVAHHREDILKFFSQLNNLVDSPNIIQESVKNDANDEFIQALVCVIAIVYCKILGPYWQLLKSNEEYLNFRRYVQCLHWKLLHWAEDASSLLLPECSDNNVFHQFPLQERNFSGVFLECSPSSEKLYAVLVEKCLEKVVKTIADCTETHLKDFLQGGRYNKDPSVELCLELRTCQLSHLMGEYPYGHANPYQWKVTDRLDATPVSSPKSTQALPATLTQLQFGISSKSPDVKMNHTSLSERNVTPRFPERTEICKQGEFSEMSISEDKEREQGAFIKKLEIAAIERHVEPSISKQDVDCLVMKSDRDSGGNFYPCQWKISEDLGATPASDPLLSTESSPGAPTQHRFNILVRSPVNANSSLSERNGFPSFPERSERYKRGAFSEKSTNEEKEQEQDVFMKKSVIAAVAKYGGPCLSKQDVDSLLMKLGGVSYAQKRDAIRCEINYQKMVLGNSDETLNHVGFSLTDMVEKLKIVLPDKKEVTSISLTHWEVEDGQKKGQECDLLVPVSAVSNSKETPVNQSPGSETRSDRSFNLEEGSINT